MADFKRELFGYNKGEVDKRLGEDALKMDIYQKDVEYLKKQITKFEIDPKRDI